MRTSSSLTSAVTAPGNSPARLARLSSDQVLNYTRDIIPSRSVTRDATRILDKFEADGIPAFNRSDLNLILQGMGYGEEAASTDEGDSGVLNVLLDRSSKADTSGWWVLPLKESVAVAPTTREWFEQQIRDSNLDGRCSQLLHRKRWRARHEDILSHVHLWFSKWSAEGTCDEHLAKGMPPRISTLVVWLNHKWSQDEYHRAKDALNREVGMRTQSEIRHRRLLGHPDYLSPGAEKIDTDAYRVFFKKATCEKAETLMTPNFVDAPKDPMARIFNEEAMALIRDLITLSRPKGAPRYIRFAEHYFGGLSRAEAAEREGCTLLRAGHLYQRVRDDIKKAPAILATALKVLNLIDEEPWSTLEEISEEIPEAAYALKLLDLRGFVSEGTGKAFAPTEAGRNAVKMGCLV